MLLFLIGLSSAQLFQVQMSSLRAAPRQFVMTGGAVARPAVEFFASPPRLVVRPCAEKASFPWALCAVVPIVAFANDARRRCRVPCFGAGASRSRRRRAPCLQMTSSGTVKYFDSQKGFGFIQPQPPAAYGAPPELCALPNGASATAWRSTHEFTATRLAARPAAFLLRNFLSDGECASLIAEARASGGLHEATTSGGTSARKHCEICCLGMDSAVVRALSQDASHLLLSDAARAVPGNSCVGDGAARAM